MEQSYEPSLSEQELIDLLASLVAARGDHERVEAKKAVHDVPRSLHETLSAFANGSGGTVLLGVDEKAGFAAVGVSDARSTIDKVVSLSERMSPPLRLSIGPVVIEGATVVVVQVPALRPHERPCHRADLPPWESSYIRVGDGDRRLTAYEVSVLLANRTPNQHDRRPVDGATVADLDRDLVADLLGRVRARSDRLGGMEDVELMRQLNVVALLDGVPVPTLAGLLALGRYPQHHRPQLNISFVAYPTVTAGLAGPRGERFLDNRPIDGPIPVMVSDAVAALKRHMKQRSIVTGVVRIDEWEYPETVLREALANALAHRDYSNEALGAQVQVELFPDRLVVRNPGGLFGPLRVDELGLDGSSPASTRNPSLLRLLEDTPLDGRHVVCENRGSGITTMRLALSQAGMEPPRFDDGISTFTVTIPNHALIDESAAEWLSSLDVAGLNRSQLTALAHLRRGETLTNVRYREATGVVDSRAATSDLQELRRRGLVEQHGDRGATEYRLGASATPMVVAEPPPADDEGPEGRVATPMQATVLAALSWSQPRSKQEIADVTGLAGSQVLPVLRVLRDRGLVRMVGRPRSHNAAWLRVADPPVTVP